MRGKVRPSPPLTHFLCLPLVTDVSRPQLRASLGQFAADVQKCGVLDGLADDAAGTKTKKVLRPLSTLHLTIGVMSLAKQQQQQQRPSPPASTDAVAVDAADAKKAAVGGGEDGGRGSRSDAHEKQDGTSRRQKTGGKKPKKGGDGPALDSTTQPRKTLEEAVAFLQQLNVQQLLTDEPVEQATDEAAAGPAFSTRKAADEALGAPATPLAPPPAGHASFSNTPTEGRDIDGIAKAPHNVAAPHGCSEETAAAPALGSSPLTVTLRSLKAIGSPQKTSVVYIEPADPTNRLLPFCLRVRQAFEAAGLIQPEKPRGGGDGSSRRGNGKKQQQQQQQQGGPQLLLHATVLNTVYSSPKKQDRPSTASNRGASVRDDHSRDSDGGVALDRPRPERGADSEQLSAVTDAPGASTVTNKDAKAALRLAVDGALTAAVSEEDVVGTAAAGDGVGAKCDSTDDDDNEADNDEAADVCPAGDGEEDWSRKGKGEGKQAERKRRGRRHKKVFVDARQLIERYNGFVFAEGIRLEKLAICEMGAKPVSRPNKRRTTTSGGAGAARDSAEDGGNDEAEARDEHDDEVEYVVVGEKRLA